MFNLSLLVLYMLLLSRTCFVGASSLATPPLSSPQSFAGLWRYRSFFNLPQTNVTAQQLLFAHGDFNLTVDNDGVISGTLTGGDFRNPNNNWELTVSGYASEGEWMGVQVAQAKIKALGINGTTSANWNYEYVVARVPQWTDGNDQLDSFVGSVERICCHEPIGLVASLASTRASEDEWFDHSSLE